jgi:hypothetical protein
MATVAVTAHGTSAGHDGAQVVVRFVGQLLKARQSSGAAVERVHVRDVHPLRRAVGLPASVERDAAPALVPGQEHQVVTVPATGAATWSADAAITTSPQDRRPRCTGRELRGKRCELSAGSSYSRSVRLPGRLVLSVPSPHGATVRRGRVTLLVHRVVLAAIIGRLAYVEPVLHGQLHELLRVHPVLRCHLFKLRDAARRATAAEALRDAAACTERAERAATGKAREPPPAAQGHACAFEKQTGAAEG